MTKGSEATLALKDGRAAERASSSQIIRALIGVEMPADVFARVLIGCEFEGLSTMSYLGPRWGRLPSNSGGTLFVRRSRESDVWRPKALFRSGESLQWLWRVDYADFSGDFPERMRVRSADGRTDLDLRVSQLDLDPNLPPTFFDMAVAPDARPLIAAELKNGEILSLAEE